MMVETQFVCMYQVDWKGFRFVVIPFAKCFWELNVMNATEQLRNYMKRHMKLFMGGSRGQTFSDIS